MKLKWNNKFIISILISLICMFCFNTKYTKIEGLGEVTFSIRFLKWEIFYLGKKKNKITTLLIFGCGFQKLGEFKRWFIFGSEVNNNDLEILEK